MTLSYTPVDVESFAASASGTWVSYDLYTNKSVPKGAVAEIIIRNSNVDNEREGGVRRKESVVNRVPYGGGLEEAESGGYTTCGMFVQTDASDGTIEVYAEVNTDVDFVLIGYLEGCDYVDVRQILDIPPQGWTEYDLSVKGVPANAVCQILLRRALSGSEELGVREKGSSLARVIDLDECEPNMDGGNLISILVKADSASKIEIYSETGSGSVIYLLGWFGSNVDFAEGWTHQTFGSKDDNVWISKTITEAPANSIAVFALVHQDSGAETYCGLREYGSSQERKILEHEQEGGGGGGFQACITLDASKRCEILCGDGSEGLFYYAGYFIELYFGILNVDTSPVKGEVFVEEESWGTAPQERELLVGFYAVSFGDVSGYATPDPVEAEVIADQTTYVDEVYTEAWYCTLNGTITATEENCVERGFDWGEAPDTYTEECIEEGSFGVGSFSGQIIGLHLEKTYYFRAKARNAGGWGYGDEKSVVYSEVSVGWMQLIFVSEPPTGGAYNKLAYDSEPPTPGAWNKLKREA